MIEIPSTLTIIATLIVLLLIRVLVKYVIRPLLMVLRFKKVKGAFCKYTPPILGFIQEMDSSLQLYNDYQYINLQRIATDPSLRLGVSCFLDTVFVDLYDPELIKEFFSKQTRFTIKDPRLFGPMSRLAMEGLVFIEGEKWKSQRKLVSSVFHFDYMNRFIPTINQIAQEWIQENCNNNKTSAVDLHQNMKAYTSRIVWRMFFGEDGFANKEEANQLSQVATKNTSDLNEMCMSPFNLFIGPIFFKLGLRSCDRQAQREIQMMENFFRKKLEFYKERLEQERASNTQSDRPKNLIELLLEDSQKATDTGERLTDYEIMAQIFTFFVAGTETTSNLLIMANYCLAQNPEVQNRLREEISKYNGEITYEVLSKMEYLNAVVKEALRLYSPADGLFPRAATEDTMLGDVLIKKGYGVNVNMRVLQGNPKFFSNPEEFRPERWIEKSDIGVKDPFMFLPFGAGGRRCIGEQLAYTEAKIILIELVRRFKIEIQKPYTLRMSLKLAYQSLDPMTAIYTKI